MKIKMMKVFDMLGIPLIVVVKNYRTMVTITMVMVTGEDVQLVLWVIRIMLMDVVKLIIMCTQLLRVKVKMSMCFN